MKEVIYTWTPAQLSQLGNDVLDVMLARARHDGVLTREQVMQLLPYRVVIYEGSFWGRFLKWLRSDDGSVRIQIVRLPADAMQPPGEAPAGTTTPAM